MDLSAISRAGFHISNVQIDGAFTNLANQSNSVIHTRVSLLKVDMKKKKKK